MAEGNVTANSQPTTISDMMCLEGVEVLVYGNNDGSGLGINWEDVNWEDACRSFENTTGNSSYWLGELNAIYLQTYPPTPEIYLRVRHILSIYVLSSVCLFGLVANFLILVLLLLDKKKTGTVYFLLALAVTDELVLLAKVIIPGRFVAGRTEPMTEGANLAVQVLAHTSETIEVWMIVAMTLERFIVVCFPLRARTLCTARNARLVILGVFLGSVIYRIPLYVRYADIIYNIRLFDIVYEITMNVIFLLILPFSVLVILNVKLMMAVYRAKRRRKDMTHAHATGSKKGKQSSVAMTFNIAAVVVLFLVCQSLRFVIFLWFVDSSYWNLTLFSAASLYPMQFVLQPIADIMTAFNSALNIFIYFLFYPKFRAQFRATICPCMKWQTLTSSTSKTSE